MEKTNPNPPQDRVEELRPCPFCKSEAAIDDFGSGLKKFSGRCIKCRAYGPLECCAADARDTWNTRPESEAVTVMREALEKIVARRGYEYGSKTIAREALARIGRL